MRLRTVFASVATLLIAGVVALLGGAAFVYSGVYRISADSPHLAVERALLTTLKRRSVRSHAEGIQAPRLDEAERIRRGLIAYREHCVLCHGAPGEARSRVGTGMNPNPPPLEGATGWSPAELYWITAHGLKMAGMPAFSLGEQPSDLWDVTAFVVRMRTLSPGEYRRLVRSLGPDAEPAGPSAWRAPDEGWSELARRGDADRGSAHVARLGCGACHRIPGVPGARGEVGPPLKGWRSRHYIAGHLVNYPHELVRWLRDPPGAVPGTAMPDLQVGEGEAWDIAAFLYTLR